MNCFHLSFIVFVFLIFLAAVPYLPPHQIVSHHPLNTDFPVITLSYKESGCLNALIHSASLLLILFTSSGSYRPAKDHQLEGELHQASHTG